MKKLLPIIAIILLAACSGSDEVLVPAWTEPGFITFGSSGRSGGIEWMDGRVETRTTENDIKSAIPQDLGVYAFGDGRNTTYIFNNQQVYYKDAKEYLDNPFDWNYWHETDETKRISRWPYTTIPGGSVQRPWDEMHYRFFAYSPWYADEHVSVTAENYSGFNSFTWDNIPGFSDKDHVLANEIIEVNNTGVGPNGNAIPTMSTRDTVCFSMRHIFSRIRFFFKMDPHYRTIRQIKIDSLTVLTAGKVKTATFNFTNNTWDETVHWSNEQVGNAKPVTIGSTDGLPYEVLTDYDDYPKDEKGKPLPFNSIYVYPQEKFSELKMRIIYTVSDVDGQTTREAKVTNTITIKGPTGDGWTLLSGYYYDIKINIVPAYLYVLSDNDKDFDGWVIIKDS